MPDQLTYPYQYHAYGLDIISQLPVTGFEAAVVSEADVTIRLGDVPESLPDAINKGVLYQSTETEFLLQIDKVANYYIRSGKEIVVQPQGNSLHADVSAFISGTAFGALMHQRRLLPIHASTVIYHDKCLVFAGNSGSGKSTLAASVIQAGGTLVADDISVIDFRGDKPAVCPAFPTLKIWEDSMIHLGLPIQGLQPVRENLRKFYLPVSRFSTTTMPISYIFIIATHNFPELQTKVMLGMDKFIMLKKHTYLFKGISKSNLAQNHFILSNKLAFVPVILLNRPNNNFNTEYLIQYLNQTITVSRHETQ